MKSKLNLKRKHRISIFFDEPSVHLAVITLGNMKKKKYVDH